MKSLLYIEENINPQKQRSEFIKDILRKEYDVYEFVYTPQNIDSDNFKLAEEKTFDVVVCWRVIPPRNILDEKISFKKGIIFPIHNENTEIDSTLLHDYNDFLIINFSGSIYLQCLSNGIRSLYIPYFPDPTDDHDINEQNSNSFWNHTKNYKLTKWINDFCDDKKNILCDKEFFLDNICTNKINIEYLINYDKFHIYVMCKYEDVLSFHNIIEENNWDINIVTNRSELEFIDAYLCSNLNNESLVNDKKWISKYTIHDEFDIKTIIKDIEENQINYPKVTIVTVVYNIINDDRREYLIRCFNSIHHQIYDGEIEHLVIDGGSTDGTLDLLACYAQKGWIQFFSEPDNGIYDAMNKGLSKATGQFIAYINSDDSYSKVFTVKCCIKSLIAENADYCFGNTLIVSLDGTWHSSPGNLSMFPFGAHYCHQSMFVKTSIMREAGGFNIEYKIAADDDIMLRMYVLQKKHTYVDLYYAKYRLGGWSMKNSQQFIVDHAMAFYKWIGQNCGLTFDECLQMRNGKFVNWPLNTFISVFSRLSDDHISRAVALRYFNINDRNAKDNVTQYFFYKKFKYKLLSHLPIKSKRTYYKNKYKTMKAMLNNAKITKIYLVGIIIMTKIKFNNIIFFNLARNIPLVTIRHDKNSYIYVLGIKIFRLRTKN